MRPARAACAVLAGLAALRGCGGGDEEESLGAPVSYADVQAVFDEYGCAGCHPGVNSALDLRPGRSYGSLVGVQALEDPTLARVVAGDPGRSFLYLKLGGDPPLLDIPAIGTRMPPGAPPIDPADLDTVRRWILQGAKDVDGETKGPVVPSPGSPPRGLDVAAAPLPPAPGRSSARSSGRTAGRSRARSSRSSSRARTSPEGRSTTGWPPPARTGASRSPTPPPGGTC